MRILKRLLGKVRPIYDIRVFELLPLKIKASVLEISEYFYYWRKFCEDFRHRIYYCESYKEKLDAVRRGKRWLK